MKKFLAFAAMLLATSTIAFAGDYPDQGKGFPPGTPDWREPSQRHNHGYVCQFEGNMKGLRLGFGIGAQFLGGKGAITCVDHRGQHVSVPVKYRLAGAGLGFDLNWVRKVRVVTGGLGIVSSPYALTGSFAVGASTGATLIKRGISINSAIAVKKHVGGIAFEMGLQGEKAYGLGARLHGMVMWIKPVHANDQYDAAWNF